MSEISKFEAYKKKLSGICDENDLTFRFRNDTYPMSLTIRPCSGMYEQMRMLEAAEEEGYRSPDASIVFYIKDGELNYKLSDKFTIGDALFGKIRNLFRNMHMYWCQYFFRYCIENNLLSAEKMPVPPDDDTEDTPDDAEPLEDYDDVLGDESYPDDDDAKDDPAGTGEEIVDTDIDDPKIREAIRIVRMENKATASLLQRRMNIGYAEAAHIMDALEDFGIIGPYNGAEPREVLPYEEDGENE